MKIETPAAGFYALGGEGVFQFMSASTSAQSRPSARRTRHNNGLQRFQLSATCTHSAVTTAGEHTFTLNYVEDTAANKDN